MPKQIQIEVWTLEGPNYPVGLAPFGRLRSEDLVYTVDLEKIGRIGPFSTRWRYKDNSEVVRRGSEYLAKFPFFPISPVRGAVNLLIKNLVLFAEEYDSASGGTLHMVYHNHHLALGYTLVDIAPRFKANHVGSEKLYSTDGSRFSRGLRKIEVLSRYKRAWVI